MKPKPVLIALFVMLAAALALMVGCTNSGGVSAADLKGTWVVESFGAPNGLTDAAQGVTTEITFDDGGKASGNGGVNSYSATYEAADGGDLTFGPVMSTKMAGPPEAMAQESAFFSALEKTRRFEFNDGKLVLAGTGNDTLAVLVSK
ncbi:MAG: META domain-containing protein [Actinobacteria bacterium]|nr:MAG: META domain-containing protein [Actinomycetota bacterium]